MANLRMMTLHGDLVAYRDEGAGEVLLLIHGMGDSSLSWREVIPKLATKYRVIAPDLLGHGESDKPRGDYSLGAFAVWLRDFLDALNIQKVTLIGHSLGGGIAMQFIHQHKKYCDRLVLVSSGGLGGDVSGLLRVMALPGAELVLPLVASRPVIKAGDMLRAKVARDVVWFNEAWRVFSSLSDSQNRKAFVRTLRSVIDHRGQAVSALNRLHKDVPTLIITGDHDPIIPASHAHSAHAAIPGSRLHVIPGVWHHPQMERPDTVAGFIEDFLAETGVHSPQGSDAVGLSLIKRASADDHTHRRRRGQPVHPLLSRRRVRYSAHARRAARGGLQDRVATTLSWIRK